MHSQNTGQSACSTGYKVSIIDAAEWKTMVVKLKNVALIAHDDKKDDLAAWAKQHEELLKPHALFCTGTTGSVLAKTCPELNLTLMKSGPLGGDQQIGAMIASGDIDLLVFFTDPLSPHPHDVDVKALARLATVYDLPMACSPATANLIMASGFLG